VQDAVDRANVMLASAVRLQVAVAEQERILRDPANRRLSGREVLQKVAPALQAGSSESARFNRALVDNRRLVDQCKPLTRRASRAGQRCMVANTITFDR
jgi:hypothetical protein